MNSQWSRAVLKRRARAVLRKSYRRTFKVCLIATLLSGVSVLIFDFLRNAFLLDPLINLVLPPLSETLYVALYIYFVVIVTLLFGCSFAFFINNPIQVGARRFLFDNTKSPANVSTIYSTFSDGCYTKTVGKMAMRWLIRFVILAAVPIALYVYFVISINIDDPSNAFLLSPLYYIFPTVCTVAGAIVWVVVELMLMPLPYILAENPRIPLKRAFALARAMTHGQKGRMFLLELSFLGWELLGVLCFGVGLLFVLPYVEATHAELYGALRWNAAQTGICTPDEIGAESCPAA